MSDPFDDTFAALDILGQIGIRLVPERPTRDMCAAGAAAAGDVDPQLVLRIYNAMLMAAATCSLHGDQTLN